MDSLSLPFKPGDRILDLGGGENPLRVPGLEVVNADLRWVKGVDLPGVDMSWPLPIPSESFDGVHCAYGLEHLSWRKAALVPREVFRVLKPGGVAVFITSDLYQQCKEAVKRFHEDKGWENVSELLFGSQEFGLQWDAGAHHCGFSKEEAKKLFQEAGFLRVEVTPHPVSATDMVVIAWKSGAQIL